MPLDHAQKGVLKGMASASVLALLALAGGAWFGPKFLALPESQETALVATLRWDMLVLICLIAAIGNLARHRFFTPADIDGSGLTAGSEKARIYQSILQNTVEQAVIAVLAHLLWSAAMPPSLFGAVPMAAILFVIGRIAFAAGYASGASARAFGFALTFYPTALLTLVAAIHMIWQGIAG